jgi:hypothetical protein
MKSALYPRRQNSSQQWEGYTYSLICLNPQENKLRQVNFFLEYAFYAMVRHEVFHSKIYVHFLFTLCVLDTIKQPFYIDLIILAALNESVMNELIN